MSEPITETDLHAYADDRLDASGRARVEAWLADHPDRAAEVADWRAQNAAIRALYADIPRDFDIRAMARPARPALLRPLMAVAAALVLMLAGGAIGYALRAPAPGAGPADRLVASALAAHALYVNEQRHAVEVAASEAAHLSTWLSNRLDRTLGMPDLSAEGFALVGGRLLPPEAGIGVGPAAQLMYENADAERITLYVTAAPTQGPAWEFGQLDGFDAVYWANATIACTVVGPLPGDRLRALADRVIGQLV